MSLHSTQRCLARVPSDPFIEALGLLEASNRSKGFRFVPLGVVELPAKLQAHPERSRISEVPGEPQRCRGSDAPSFVDQFVDSLVGHSDSISEVALGQAHRLEEFLKQHLARVRGFPMRRYSNHGEPLDSMIVNDLDSIRAICRPYETDSILVVDTNAELSRPVVRQGLKSVSRRDPQFLKRVHRIQLIQLPRGDSPQTCGASPAGILRAAAVEDILRSSAREGSDHQDMIARLPCYDQPLSPTAEPFETCRMAGETGTVFCLKGR